MFHSNKRKGELWQQRVSFHSKAHQGAQLSILVPEPKEKGIFQLSRPSSQSHATIVSLPAV